MNFFPWIFSFLVVPVTLRFDFLLKEAEKRKKEREER